MPKRWCISNVEQYQMDVVGFLQRGLGIFLFSCFGFTVVGPVGRWSGVFKAIYLRKFLIFV